MSYKLKFNHATFHLCFRKKKSRCLGEDSLGETDLPHKKGKKRIYIRKGMKDKDDMETILHEIAHAMFPHASEEAVEELGRIQRKALRWRGYHRD